jgi:hypothetical protein
MTMTIVILRCEFDLESDNELGWDERKGREMLTKIRSEA